MWTLPQRRALVILLVFMLGYLSWRAISRRQYVPETLGAEGVHAEELLDRLDPNTATEAQLAAVEPIGPKRAAAIVAYRSRIRAMRAGQVVFKRPEDLLAVQGIGVATLDNARSFLQFPSDTSAPAKDASMSVETDD